MLYFSHGYTCLWPQRLNSVIDYLQESLLNLEKAPPLKLQDGAGATAHLQRSGGLFLEQKGGINIR